MKKNMISFLFCLFVYACQAKDLTNATLYLNLCTEFWDLDRATVPADQYEFYKYYMQNTKGAILEPMCGSGRFLIPFVLNGFNVEGFDASPCMYKSLLKKCKEKGISPRVWEQYLDDVPETKKYDLIFLPDTSFTIFTELQNIKDALKKIHSLLAPKGKFVFDVQTIHSRWGDIGVWTGIAHQTAEGNMLVASYLPLPIQNSISPLILRFDLMGKTGIIKTETEHYKAKLYHFTEMDDLLKEAGFKKIKRMKGYDRNLSPSPDDLVIVYECTK
jgi:SAM-dependent methyltransferase